ncbi:hypothetical protein AVEN_119643-1 [Araneus ventricosus]|uniref:Uncharacterized protein n=1 Tax=Araneus ventricosus TaxID=182803 RepID=A0A4Y2PD16_ARAVE|nr:hypothetical protein AVEN_119643-1 [Araneus ventricosus]
MPEAKGVWGLGSCGISNLQRDERFGAQPFWYMDHEELGLIIFARVRDSFGLAVRGGNEGTEGVTIITSG